MSKKPEDDKPGAAAPTTAAAPDKKPTPSSTPTPSAASTAPHADEETDALAQLQDLEPGSMVPFDLDSGPAKGETRPALVIRNDGATLDLHVFVRPADGLGNGHLYHVGVNLQPDAEPEPEPPPPPPPPPPKPATRSYASLTRRPTARPG